MDRPCVCDKWPIRNFGLGLIKHAFFSWHPSRIQYHKRLLVFSHHRMFMSRFELKIDVDTGEPVADLLNLQLAGLPPFIQAASLPLRLWFIRRVAGLAAYVPVSGVTLEAAL